MVSTTLERPDSDGVWHTYWLNGQAVTVTVRIVEDQAHFRVFRFIHVPGSDKVYYVSDFAPTWRKVKDPVASAIHRMLNQGVITPPKFLEPNLMLEVIMGSRAYGVNEPDSSDYDIYGICIPPKAYVFPATAGLVVGYDDIPAMKVWSEHHVQDQDARRSYDFSVYNIAWFFQLAEENNPNMVDTLFVPETNVKHCTTVGRMILDNRHLFLSKLCWKRFRGYASDQFHKLKEKNPEGKRKELVERFGYDIKFGYHVIRLLREAEQILTEHDLDLVRGNDELKAIRRGEWTLERLEQEFVTRKLAMESLYANSTLREQPDHAAIRQLLLDCLESHYGSLGKVVVRPDFATDTLRQIDKVLDGIRDRL